MLHKYSKIPPSSQYRVQAGLRNRPAYNPTQYSVEWANVVTSYMRKQLLEIALPMAPRPGLNIKHTFKGVLADQDSRDRWLSRFTYWYVSAYGLDAGVHSYRCILY